MSDQTERSGSDPLTMLEFIEQLGISDPKVRKLAQLMALQNAAPVGASEEQASVQDKEDQNSAFEENMLRDLIEENEYLKEENRFLVEQIETLAAALGACPWCLGNDKTCDECRGEGKPGAFMPEKDSFKQYVLPVVRSLRRQVAVKKTRERKIDEKAQRVAAQEEKN